MRRISAVHLSRVIAAAMWVWIALTPVPAAAQPAGDQMCGIGTGIDATYEVSLPVVDDSPGGGLVFPFADLLADTIRPPKGCDIYLLIVSDVGRNRAFDELLFYPLAKFVAEHNGYVHYSWWNNLLDPYMGGTVHGIDAGVLDQSARNHPGRRYATNGLLDTIIAPFLGEGEYEVYLSECTYPGTQGFFGSILDLFGQAGCAAVTAARDLFLSPVLRRPFPDSMKQFVADAAEFVKRTREENPNAVIIIAGHGLGGHAAALVSERLSVENAGVIDLLAPIDPYSSTSERDGSDVTDGELTGSRLRAHRPIAYYSRRECRRNAIFLCRNYGTFFSPRYECFTFNEQLEERPVVGSFAPFHCPGPVVVYRNRAIGNATRYLYHRYQTETGPPADFTSTRSYIHSTSLPLPIEGSAVVATCTGNAPLNCTPVDGHDELVGFRGGRASPTPFGVLSMPTYRRVPIGVRPASETWPRASIEHPGDLAWERRQAMIEMAMPDPDGEWSHRPVDPQLCLVCDDLVALAEALLDERADSETELDVTAPVTTGFVDPGANPEGWHAGDVQVTLSATDAGDGVSQIHYSVSGAQSSGTVIVGGSTAQVTVTAEGTTTVSFFARDHAGNQEAPTTLEVHLDRTPPDVAADTDVGPNLNGWNNGDVRVSFPASDALSGLVSSSPDVVVSSEGAAQEIIGTADDKAGNVAAASAVVSIDRTAPGITLASRSPAANAAGWNRTDVSVAWDCTDERSGAALPAIVQSLTSEGEAQAVVGTCADLADNTASDTQTNVNIDKTNPAVAISSPAEGASYLLNAAVVSDYGCTDGLSGLAACAGPVPSGGAVMTSVVGATTFTVTGSDVAGNTTSATHGYAVRYGFSGFSNPIGPAPMVNVAKAGRTVPVKYHLRDANGSFIADLTSFLSLSSHAVACDGAALDVPVETTDAAGSTTIRYDDEASQFVYNWKTDGGWAGSCRMLQLSLSDGTSHTALFEFR